MTPEIVSGPRIHPSAASLERLRPSCITRQITLSLRLCLATRPCWPPTTPQEPPDVWVDEIDAVPSESTVRVATFHSLALSMVAGGTKVCEAPPPNTVTVAFAWAKEPSQAKFSTNIT